MRYVIESATYQTLTAAKQDLLADWLDAHGVASMTNVAELVVDEDEGSIVVTYLVHDANRRVRLDSDGEPEIDVQRYRLIDPFPTALAELAVIWIIVVPRRTRHVKHISPHYLPKEIHYIMANVTVHDDQAPFQAHFVLVDVNGNVVEPDDIPQWASSAENVAKVSAVTADGKTATIAVAALGVAQITCVTVDNNGTKIIMDGSINVEAGSAVKGEITFDVASLPTPAVPVATPVPDTTTPTPDAAPAAAAPDATTPAPAPAPDVAAPDAAPAP